MAASTGDLAPLADAQEVKAPASTLSRRTRASDLRRQERILNTGQEIIARRYGLAGLHHDHMKVSIPFLLLSLALACRPAVTEDTDGTTNPSGSTGSTGGDPPEPPDPGDAMALGCGAPAWARIDESATIYRRVHVFNEGGTLVSGDTRHVQGFVQGFIVRRGPDAEVRSTLVGAGSYGSTHEAVGVDDSGRYLVTGTDHIQKECYEDPEWGLICNYIDTHWLRSYTKDDQVAWEQSAAERVEVIEVAEDGSFFRGPSKYGPDGELLWSRSPPPGYGVHALATDGGFFGRTVVAPIFVAKFDANLALVWQIHPIEDFQFGGFDPLTATADGGLALIGVVEDAVPHGSVQRLLTLDADGVERWRDDIGEEDIFSKDGLPVSAVASGSGGWVALAGMSYHANLPWIRGWIRVYKPDGSVAWTIRDCPDLATSDLTVDGDQILVVGSLLGDGTEERAFLAAYPLEQSR